MAETPDTIIIERLVEWHEPYSVLGLDPKQASAMLAETPVVDEFLEERDRGGPEWHWGRIRYFLENPTDDPIGIDNHASYGYFGPPMMYDGHHRMIAAILRGDKTITAWYSGTVSTLDYLTGKTDEKPEF